ncbi:MAG: NAD(P)/FAD-dependent oxidoreductase [Actinomycetota bacterium]
MRSNPMREKLHRYRAAVAAARDTGADPDEVFGQAEEQHRRGEAISLERSHALQDDRERVMDAIHGGISRRQFLRQSALLGMAFAGAGALTAGPFARRADAAAPRIVVVGGGLAGTTAAYRINRLKGWIPEIYEAQGRIGGRTRTIHGLSNGQYAEAGGGGINTRDNSIKALAQEVGLWPLVDTWDNYPGGGSIYVFNGRRYTWDQIKSQANANYSVFWKKWVEIGKKIPTYRNATTAAKKYDNMSALQLLNNHCPNGTNTVAGELMATWFGVDYAGLPSQASAIHFVLEEAGIWGGGGWDERYAIPGGNEELSQALANALPDGSVHLDHALVAIVANGNGTTTLTFDDGSSLIDVVADKVVLAIPPTALDDVDLSQAGFSAVKMRSISREKLGPNAKYNLQFSPKPWSAVGDAGDGTTDNGLGEFWQANFLSANPGVLIGMNNVNYGAHPAHGTASSAARTQILGWIEQLWPGASSKFIAGQAYLDYWPNDPWAKGSYSYYPVGGFTTFGGIQPKRQGNVHFAGEHTASYIERGYMNGAVATGERAAREVVS